MNPLARVPLLARHVRRRLDPITGQALLLYPEGALELDTPAAAMVDRCDGVSSVADIADALAAEYSGDPLDIAKDVAACLDNLASRGLVTFGDAR